jgi:hypothetical protein
VGLSIAIAGAELERAAYFIEKCISGKSDDGIQIILAKGGPRLAQGYTSF